MRPVFKRQKNNKNRINQSTRVAVLFCIALFVVLIYIGQLLRLQVFAGEEYRMKAQEERKKSLDIKADRGFIFDRKGNKLAVSVSSHSFVLFPKEVEDPEKTANRLSKDLGLEKSFVEEAIRSDRYEVTLKSTLSQAEIDRVEKSGLSCFVIKQEKERYYPNNNILSQTLGFINENEEGYGIEAYFNKDLRGSSGRKIYSTSHLNREILTDEKENHPAEAGHHIYLTIDLDIQKILYDQLLRAVHKHKAEEISAIILDPNNGEILAMENFPNFNPNKREEMPSTISDQEWAELKAEDRWEKIQKTWTNPSVSDLYEPGSVFKTITTAISIETKSSKPSSSYMCTGHIQISSGDTISCYRAYDPHGAQTLEEALIHSCNPAFVQIVREIGVEKYISYLSSLQIGQGSGVDLPMDTPSVIPIEKGKALEPFHMEVMSYGHSVSLTPLELIAMTSSTINGGYYYKPHVFSYSMDAKQNLYKEYEEKAGRQVFSEETSSIMRKYLSNVVKEDGSLIESIDEVEIGGKSGTTELVIDGDYSDQATVASYWSFFPVNKPKYSMLVVVKKPKSSIYGTTVAGEISANIIKAILEHEGVQINIAEQSLVEVPNVMGLTVEEAEQSLKSVGLKISVFGDMNRYEMISQQIPKVGSTIQSGETVKVEPMKERRLKLPDCTGYSEDDLKNMLEYSGISYEIVGQGRVVKQEPEAGKEVPLGENILFTLKEEE